MQNQICIFVSSNQSLTVPKTSCSLPESRDQNYRKRVEHVEKAWSHQVYIRQLALPSQAVHVPWIEGGTSSWKFKSFDVSCDQLVTRFRLSWASSSEQLSEPRHCFLHDSGKFTLETRLKRHVRLYDKPCLDWKSSSQSYQPPAWCWEWEGGRSKWYSPDGTHRGLTTFLPLFGLCGGWCETSCSPGWFWHTNQNMKVKRCFPVRFYLCKRHMNKNVARLQDPWWQKYVDRLWMSNCQ